MFREIAGKNDWCQELCAEKGDFSSIFNIFLILPNSFVISNLGGPSPTCTTNATSGHQCSGCPSSPPGDKLTHFYFLLHQAECIRGAVAPASTRPHGGPQSTPVPGWLHPCSVRGRCAAGAARDSADRWHYELFTPCFEQDAFLICQRSKFPPVLSFLARS